MHPIITIILLIILITMAWGGIMAAPWVPTLKKERKSLINGFTAKPTSTIYDLGCGSGSILFEFADHYPNATCIGYDVSILPLVIGWTIKLFSFKKYRNVHLKFGNLFNQHFTDADIVVIFLMEKSYARLKETLKRELKPTATLIVEAWPLPDVEPTNVIRGEKLLSWYIYEEAKQRLNAQ